MDIALALCNSLQLNSYKGRPDTEYSATGWLCGVAGEKAAAAGINARWFNGEPDRGGSVSNLIEQQDAAHDWLLGQPERVKVCVSIHTDSGTFSHTFGIFGRQFPESERLAEAIAGIVRSALGTADLRVFSRLGTIDYSTYIFATRASSPAALIEVCSHELPRDLEALWANGQQVAQAIVDGVVEYAKRETVGQYMNQEVR